MLHMAAFTGMQSFCNSFQIGNACLKIVEEAARRHVLYTTIFFSINLDVCMFNNLCSFLKGKNFHIVDLYAVPTWKDKNVDPVHCLPVSFFFLPRKSSIVNRQKSMLFLCMHIILSQYY